MFGSYTPWVRKTLKTSKIYIRNRDNFVGLQWNDFFLFLLFILTSFFKYLTFELLIIDGCTDTHTKYGH